MSSTGKQTNYEHFMNISTTQQVARGGGPYLQTFVVGAEHRIVTNTAMNERWEELKYYKEYTCTGKESPQPKTLLLLWCPSRG